MKGENQVKGGDVGSMNALARTSLARGGLALVGFVFACNSSPDKAADAEESGNAAVPSRTNSSSRAVHDQGTLKFRDAAGEKVASIAGLVSEFGVEEIPSQDEYYQEMKRYRAFPLAPLIKKYFVRSPEELRSSSFLLEASDGYTVRIQGDLLLHPAAYLAVADVDRDEWQPIGERGANPGPLYMVWKGTKFADKEKYPRPWALARIELLTGADRYVHTRPAAGFGKNAVAKKGYEIFDASCIRCHSINQEGGTLGPDLNVPQNILAYRPENQVRAYIKNPGTFRYSAMPPHPQFSEEDLDAIVAYLRLMGEHQHDPHEKNSKKAE